MFIFGGHSDFEGDLNLHGARPGGIDDATALFICSPFLLQDSTVNNSIYCTFYHTQVGFHKELPELLWKVEKDGIYMFEYNGVSWQGFMVLYIFYYNKLFLISTFIVYFHHTMYLVLKIVISYKLVKYSAYGLITIQSYIIYFIDEFQEICKNFKKILCEIRIDLKEWFSWIKHIAGKSWAIVYNGKNVTISLLSSFSLRHGIFLSQTL